jgi:aminomethyltransferase
MSARHEDVAEIDAWISRSGYTGEDGFELFCAASDAATLWNLLLRDGASAGIEPAGLGARDVLRIEVCYPLYGHEINRDTSPVDARLTWVVQSGKGDFLGRQAILDAEERGPRCALVGIVAEERCIPRDGQSVLVDGEVVGHVTSGTFSPTLKAGIAMAYVRPDAAGVGSPVSVDVRGKPCRFRIVPTPFYKAATAFSTTTRQIVRVKSDT